MDSTKVKIKLAGKSHQYDIKIGHNLLANCGIWASRCLAENTHKIALISNEKVFGLYGDEVRRSLSETGFQVFVWLMEDGEEYKNFESLRDSLGFFSKNNLTRTDAVIALGGGVIGDLAGFASAIYLRGITFLQIPTTVLAMIDSSVGGKTAVNTTFGKNLIGSFYQPDGVLVDIETLRTLEQRELIAGFCEAVKQGSIGSRQLFDETAKFLKTYLLSDFPNYFSDKNFKPDLESLLASQISFKAQIVMQDEHEATGRIDAQSRKILNFGHTTAHALEKLTNYTYFKHGEAVGYGLLVAGEISKRLDIFDNNSIKLLNDVVARVGQLPDTSNINIEDLLDLFVFDKKSIGKSLQWILLEDIGKPRIVSSREIPPMIIKESLKAVLHKNKKLQS